MRRFRSSDRLGGSTSVFRVVALPSRQLEARQRLFLEILAKQVSESGDSRRIAITECAALDDTNFCRTGLPLLGRNIVFQQMFHNHYVISSLDDGSIPD